jgi:hypothetical protein
VLLFRSKINTILSTDPGSFKLTDISHRLRFSFVSVACIVRSFFVCLRFVRFVYHLFRSSV